MLRVYRQFPSASSNNFHTRKERSAIPLEISDNVAAPGQQADVQKKSYKIEVDEEKARRRWEDNLVEIRKSKGEDNLLKKRREGIPNGTLLQQHQQLFTLDPSQSPVEIVKKLKSIHMMVHGVWSDDPAAQVKATTQFRKLLSISIVFHKERSPPIDEVIKSGVIPRFVDFLDRNDLPQLQFA